MWFGTNDGLNRYDGYGYTCFKPTTDPYSINHNTINCIAEDRNGNLWIGSENGLHEYIYTTGDFKNYIIRDESSVGNNPVKDILEDKEGMLWISTGSFNFYKFNPFEESFDTLSIKDQVDALSFIKIHQIQSSNIIEKGYLWLCTDSGLFIYNKKKNEAESIVKKYDFIPQTIDISKYPVTCILEDPGDSILWFGTWGNGIYKLDFSNKKIENISSKSHPTWKYDRVTSLAKHQLNLIIGTMGGGIKTLNTRSHELSSYMHESTNIETLSGNFIFDLFVDETNILWVGTKYGGISKTNLNPTGFKSIYSGVNIKYKGITKSLHQTAGKTIWIGNHNGELLRLDTNLVITGKYNIPRNDDGISSSINVITNFQFNGREMLLIGTDGDGVYMFNPVNEKFIEFTKDNKAIMDGNVFDILITDNNLVWLAGYGTTVNAGLKLYDPYSKNLFEFKSEPSGKKQSMPNSNIIKTLIEDNNGVIWIGTRGGGVNKLTYALSDDNTAINAKFKYFVTGGKKSISHNEVHSMYEDKEGYIWIGTGGGGLNRLNPFNEEFKIYTSENGLPSNMIYGIMNDSDDNLWISTSNGLSKFCVKEEEFQNFDIVDGLSANVFTQRACLKDHNNRLFFGNINGGNYFHPDSLEFNKHVPPVKLTGLKLSNQKIKAGEKVDNLIVTQYPPALTNKITLKKNFKVVTFEFAALDYTAPSKNKYKYQLLGFDEDMITTNGNNRSVTYTNLKPGKYTFKVIASNNDGVWNTSGLVLQVRVKPPFYQSLVFKIFIFLLTIAGIAYLLYNNTRKVEIQKKLIKEEATEKIREERNQLRTLIDNVPDLIYIKDKDCRFISGNTALMKTMKAKSESDILGKTDFDFYPYEIASKFFHDDQKVIKTGFPIINKEEPGIGQDKNMVFISSTKVPLRNAKGKVIGLVGIGRNITREKLAEIKLKERTDVIEQERNQLRTLIDNLPDRIYIKDKESRFIAANEMLAKIMGVSSPTELIGKCDHDFYNLEMANKFYRDEQEIIKSGKPLINIEETGLDEHKEKVIILTTKIPLKNSKGESIGLVGIGRNITKIKRIEAQLRKQTEDLQEVNVLLEERQEEVQQQAEELNAQTENLKEVNTELQKLNATKDKFFSIIAHDLKNPFNAIISLSDFLTKDFNLMPDNEKLELVKLINISSENAYSLLENLLQWARTQTDRIKYNPQPLQLKLLIEENLKFHKINSDRKNIRLEQEVDDELMVYADKNMINLVLRNLLSNAVKFTNINGLIKVVAKKIKRENSSIIEISVQDNGVGIEEEYIERLFRIDEHHSTSGTTGETGTGLGLIVCKEFINKNNGNIHVKSEKGKGSIFIFTLPSADKN